tara:strand:- start:96 stop:281 length:186 start_codon:yes stop_codon:yes gene_type:complete
MDNQQRLIIGLVSLVLFLLGGVIGIIGTVGLAFILGEWLYGYYITSSDRIGPKPKLNEAKE